jgi:hypothetical protein
MIYMIHLPKQSLTHWFSVILTGLRFHSVAQQWLTLHWQEIFRIFILWTVWQLVSATIFIHLFSPTCGVTNTFFHSIKTEPPTIDTALCPTSGSCGTEMYTQQVPPVTLKRTDVLGTFADEHVQTYATSTSCFRVSVRRIMEFLYYLLLRSIKNAVNSSFVPPVCVKICQLILPNPAVNSWKSTQQIGERRR